MHSKNLRLMWRKKVDVFLSPSGQIEVEGSHQKNSKHFVKNMGFNTPLRLHKHLNKMEWLSGKIKPFLIW